MAELKNEKRVYRSALDGVLRLELLRGLVAVAAEVAAGGAVVLLPRLETHPAEVVLALQVHSHSHAQRTPSRQKACAIVHSCALQMLARVATLCVCHTRRPHLRALHVVAALVLLDRRLAVRTWLRVGHQPEKVRGQFRLGGRVVH